MALDDIGDYWIALWDAVYALVDAVGGFDVTYQGLYSPPDRWPCAWVSEGTIDYVLSDTIGTYYAFTMPIFIIDVKDDIIAGKKSAIDLAGKVQAALVADRSLGLSWLQPIESIIIDGMPRDAPQGYERQCVKITLTAHAFLDNI